MKGSKKICNQEKQGDVILESRADIYQIPQILGERNFNSIHNQICDKAEYNFPSAALPMNLLKQ